MQQLNQEKRERAEKQQKMYAQQMGWSMITPENSKQQNMENTFEKPPEEDEEEEVYRKKT